MKGLLVFFASLQFVSGIAYSSCPSGFDLVRDGECRGFVANITLTFDVSVNKALEKCGEVNAQPVIIHNDEHQSYWKERAPDTSEGFLILGLVCNSTSEKWQWVDGSPVDYKPAAGMYNKALDQDCMPDVAWDIHPDGFWSYGGAGNPISARIFCTKQLSQPPRSDDGCDGFGDDEEDGVCYLVSAAAASSWSDAEMSCTKLGAHLASIHNKQENAFIRRLAASSGAVNGIFLGGSVRKDGTFGWMDGSAWDYENFYIGFPKANFGECLAMDTTSAGQWMNIDCSAQLPVACIRSQQTVSAPECTGEDYKEGEMITSPGFPFSASTPCDFFLTVAAGKKVQAEILLLEANSCCDSVILYDGPLGGAVIATLTGEIQNANYTTKSSNIMRVSYQPKGGVNVKGLAMKFHAV